jgi:hypothetical protein
VTDDAGGTERESRFDPAPAPERVRVLRETADDLRAAERGELLAAILYRVSDLYDPAEETTPPAVYRNVRTIIRVTERGTLARDRDLDPDPGSDDGAND